MKRYGTNPTEYRGPLRLHMNSVGQKLTSSRPGGRAARLCWLIHHQNNANKINEVEKSNGGRMIMRMLENCFLYLKMHGDFISGKYFGSNSSL